MIARAIRGPGGGIGVAVAATAALTGALVPFRSDVGLLNEGLLFLFLTLLIAATWGRVVGLFAAVVTNVALNFFFVPPVHTFNVADARNVAALAIFMLVSAIGSSLLATAREAASEARRRQAETEVLLRLGRAMSDKSEPEGALESMCREAVAAFAAPGAAVLAGEDGRWSALASAGGDTAGRLPGTDERILLERALLEGSPQGLGQTGMIGRRRRKIVSSRAPDAGERAIIFVPLRLGERVLGVLRLDGPMGDSPFRERPEQLLTALAGEAALAVHRAELAKEASRAEALRQADEMKTALMASISHDLKTPLAAIKVAVSSVLDRTVRWSDEDRDALLRTIDSQADRLDRVISDILDLNRIESGALEAERAPVRAADLLDGARGATMLVTAGRVVTIEAAADTYALADEALITQSLVNLVENAAKYSRPGGAIRLVAALCGDFVELSVEDEGPGIANEDLPYVFERFYRARQPSQRVRGSGLGLTIVKAFVDLCGGTVGVDSSPAGTRFVIRLLAAKPARVVGAEVDS